MSVVPRTFLLPLLIRAHSFSYGSRLMGLKFLHRSSPDFLTTFNFRFYLLILIIKTNGSFIMFALLSLLDKFIIINIVNIHN